MAAIRLFGLGSLIALTGVAGLCGVLLLSMMATRFRPATAGDCLTPAEARAVCRHLSRTVYLVLYLLFGASLIVRITSGAALSEPPENLRLYLGYGLLVLLVIRALTVLSVRPPQAPQMSRRSERAGDSVAPQ